MSEGRVESVDPTSQNRDVGHPELQKKKRLSERTKRVLVSVAAVLLVGWVCLLAYVGHAMRQPPEAFGRVMAKMPMPAYFLFPFETMWTRARHGHVEVGDVAPDLKVERLDDRTPVQLGGLWAQKPVVLVFGSYT